MKIFLKWFIWGIGFGVSILIIKIGRHLLGSFGSRIIIGIISIVFGMGILAGIMALGIKNLIRLFKEVK